MSNLLHLTRQALHAPPALTRSYASASKKIAFQKPQANAFNRLRTAAPRGGSSASPKATKQPSHTPTPKPTTPAPANSLDYSSLESQLARLGSEKLLYAHKAPGFLFAAYSMAAGSFVYAAYTFDLTRQGEVAKWVRATSWVGICGGTLLGALAVYYPTRLVQKITSHPLAPTRTRPTGISLVLHRRPLVPFTGLTKIVIENPKLLSLDGPIEALPGSGVKEMSLGERISSLPRRWFEKTRAGVTNENFVHLRVSTGGNYALHRNGWQWEKRGLERLIGVQKFAGY